MKICSKLLIFELSDCTLRIFRGYDFSIFLNCYFWIDSLGFLIQTFEPAPPRMFSYGVPPWVIFTIFGIFVVIARTGEPLVQCNLDANFLERL